MLALLPDVQDCHILDAGCGSGWYAERLLERGATVEAVDSSEGMLRYARQRIASNSEGASSRINFKVGDLADPLPYEDETFDGVISPLVLHYIKEWRPVLTQMCRVLRPGGWVLFSTHHPAADAARSGTRNYFVTEHDSDYWEWAGHVEFFRRSLTTIIDCVIQSGFVLDALVEPEPTEEMRRSHPESWQRLMHQPEFLIVKARRPL